MAGRCLETCVNGEGGPGLRKGLGRGREEAEQRIPISGDGEQAVVARGVSWRAGMAQGRSFFLEV